MDFESKLWRNVRRFGGVEGIVTDFLLENRRKATLRLPGQHREFPGVEVFGNARRLERGSVELLA
ncbi:MAG: hypothetical protein WBY44_09650 [Bryobacteraceae bacterium]